MFYAIFIISYINNQQLLENKTFFNGQSEKNLESYTVLQTIFSVAAAVASPSSDNAATYINNERSSGNQTLAAISKGYKSEIIDVLKRTILKRYPFSRGPRTFAAL